MGIYNTNTDDFMFEGGILSNEVDESLDYAPTLESAYQIVAENEENWTNFMKATGIEELAYYERTGEELPYNEAAGSGFFEKAKAFFKAAWEKIKALFKRFFSMFDSITKSNKEFLKKYQKDLAAVQNTDKFKYKGYKFTVEDAKSEVKIVAGVGDDLLTKDNADTSSPEWKNYDSTDFADKMRGAILGKGNNSPYTASEFSKELFEAFRSKESKKEEIEGVDKGDLFGYLGGNDMKKETERTFKTLKTECENSIKEIERNQKSTINSTNSTNADENSKKIAVYSRRISEQKTRLNLLQIANGAKISAIKAKSAQYKAICSKLLTFKAKNESTIYDDSSAYNESGAFNVNFI